MIREYWRIDPNSPTGLSWIKSKRFCAHAAGDPACTVVDYKGYRTGALGGKAYKAHRAVFFLAHGYWPEQVDHIDGNRQNNQVENLREVTNKENSHNQEARGYWLHKPSGKYQASIKVEGKSMYLGLFKTEGEAREAYLAGKRRYHPGATDRCFEPMP